MIANQNQLLRDMCKLRDEKVNKIKEVESKIASLQAIMVEYHKDVIALNRLVHSEHDEPKASKASLAGKGFRDAGNGLRSMLRTEAN